LCCEGTPIVTLLPDKDPDDGTRVYRIEYQSNSSNAKVVLYRIEGGGHTWPGGWQYLGKWIIGKTSNDINGCNEIWDFFKDL
jgi:polyhydroxybutyrate depolymerase